MNLASNLKQIKEVYENGNNYFEGILDGSKYKIRMNKNHPRNSQRNDDLAIHNLSLINVKYPNAVGRKIVNKKIQKQVDNITDWEDAEIEIEEFFNEIKDEDFDKKYKNGGNMETEYKVMFESRSGSGNVREVRVMAKNFNDAKKKGWLKSGLNKKFYAFLTAHEIKELGGLMATMQIASTGLTLHHTVKSFNYSIGGL